jgi:acyl-CoA synthetase (AMP-forming)/AMP-acid ligase II
MTDIGRRLLHWAERTPQAPAFVFVSRDATIEAELTFGTLAERALGLAARLRAMGGRGETAALLFPPGLDFMVAFLGCLLAGVIAVPMALPRREARRDSADAIVENCTPAFILTTGPLMDRLRNGLAGRPQWSPDFRWLAVDEAADDPSIAAGVSPSPPGDVAFLQYTSGSTSNPKGVMVSHANLMRNLEMMQAAFGTSGRSRLASWLPLFHDMGLIGNALHALFLGAPCFLMAPLSFMQRPLAWLRVISEHRVDFAGCPNFGFDHCVDHLRSRGAEGLDLSSWRIAYNAAEPVRSATLERFATAFAPVGFDRRALYPCYGMAEATVMISGKTDRAGPPIESTLAGKPIVSCGSALPGEEIAVVDPETCRRQSVGVVGEIWVRGPHVSAGYWDNAGATAACFDAILADAILPDGGGGWLRTGDLGFLDARGELFVSGRLKDLIIVRGQNYYPQDIEFSAQEAHDAFHGMPGAAFVTARGQHAEALVVVQEADHRLRRMTSTDALQTAIRETVALDHGLSVHRAVIVRPGTVPRTTSGKVRRVQARALWEAGALGTTDDEPVG